MNTKKYPPKGSSSLRLLSVILWAATLSPLQAIAVESVTLNNPPLSVTAGSAYTVHVNYTASANRIIQVVLYNASWQSYGSAYGSVTAGSGTKSLSVTINSTASAGSGFQWKAVMFSSDWATAIGDHVVTGVTVASGGENVVLSNPPLSVTAGSEHAVNVNYTASANRIIQVVLYNASWQSYGSAYGSVTAGSGTKSLSVTISSSAPAGSGFQWKAVMFSSDWATVIDDHVVTGVTVGSGSLLSDNFEDGNSTGWTIRSGTWSMIQSPDWAFQCSSSGTVEAIRGNSSWTNYTTEAKIKPSTTDGSPGLLARYNSTNGNHYLFQYSTTGPKYRILKKISGVFTELAAATAPAIVAGTDYTYKAEVNGSTLKFSVNGALKCAATDHALTSGMVGLRGSNGAAQFDDVAVNSISGPPQPQTLVVASDSVAAIQSKLYAVPAGGSLVFPAESTFNFGGQSIKGKTGITVWANGKVTINGGGGAGTGGAFDFGGLTNWTIRGTAPGQGFVFNGSLINATGASNYAVGNCTFNDSPSNGYDGGSIRQGNSRHGLIINNDFNRCGGNALGMYNLDNITFDGNVFTSCFQLCSIQVPHASDPNWGRNIIFRRNVATKLHRAGIELGNGGQQLFDGLIVENNWFDDFENYGGEQWDTILPISLVGQASRNTTVRNNFMRRGPNNPPQFVGVAIELSGPGECYGNLIWNFGWAALTYGSGWNFHDNSVYNDGSNAYYGFANNGSGTGTFGSVTMLSSPPPVPPKPTRIAW